jgi:hypothetical protein
MSIYPSVKSFEDLGFVVTILVKSRDSQAESAFLQISYTSLHLKGKKGKSRKNRMFKKKNYVYLCMKV